MKLAIISAALAATVLGGPVDSATAQKPAAAIPRGVFFCVGYNFVPNCSYINPALGEWISFSTGNAFENTISSLSPDAGVVCQVWENKDGTGRTRVIRFPGHRDLRDIEMGNKISSITCWWEGQD